MNQRSAFRALAVVLALACIACSSSHEESGEDDSTGGVSTGDCSTRADKLALGLSKRSTSGVLFSLSSIEPSVPVQSPGPPGNSWSIEIRDSNGVPLSGALNVTTFMPDHGHAGPPTIGVESQPGLGWPPDDEPVSDPNYVRWLAEGGQVAGFTWETDYNVVAAEDREDWIGL